MIDIIFAYADGINGFDIDTVNVGGDDGNYPQGTVSVIFSNAATLLIENTSCGAFGTRMYAVLVRPDGITHKAQFGSMLESDQHYSEFTEADAAYTEAIRNALGYNIPTK